MHVGRNALFFGAMMFFLFAVFGVSIWIALNPSIPFPLALALVGLCFYWLWLIKETIEAAWHQAWRWLFGK